MFVRFSPVKPKKKVVPIVEDEIEILSLAPFTRTPKLAFDMVEVDKPATRKLLIKNPTKGSVRLHIIHDIPSQMQVSFSWDEMTIDEEGEILLVITWNPPKEVCCRNVIIFKDLGVIRKSIPIAFKSVYKKMKAKVNKSTKCRPRTSPRKSPTVKYYGSFPVRTLKKNESPKKYSKSSEVVTNYSPKHKILSSSGKENKSPSIIIHDPPNTESWERRETFSLKQVPYFDSLENISQAISPLSNTKRSPLSAHTASNISHDISLATYLQTNLGNKDDLTPVRKYFSPPSASTSQKPTSEPKINECSINSLFHTGRDFIHTNEKTYTLSTRQILNPRSTLRRSLSNSSLTSVATYIIDNNEKTCNLSTSECDKSGETYMVNKDDVADLASLGCDMDIVSDLSQQFRKRKSILNKNRESFTPYGRRQNVSSGIQSWSKIRGNAFRIAKHSSGLSFQNSTRKLGEESPRLTVQKNDTSILVIQNPFLLAATNLVDPFLTSAIKIDEGWISKQQIHLKNWLNKILSPPPEFCEIEETVDVTKIWRECTKQEETAPYAIGSTNILQSKNMLKIRELIRQIYFSPEVSKVLEKVNLSVKSGKINIRDDRDIPLNVALKKTFVELLLSYHPLWLRIGMETVFLEDIPLKSNNDVSGLSSFIMNYFLKDKKLLKKYKTPLAPKYKAELNKHILVKYFSLVYILDQAKNKRIIPHDPCLFSKRSAIKESREMLLFLSRELVSSVGDITKVLKSYGYIVTHTQTYIEEFNYHVDNLGVDLRDGIRLTKVSELILNRKDLTNQLRVPAISRLQKVHNVSLAFDTLKQAGYDILYDISPKDIADGHREKTLSFLWQIIYKFEAPLMLKSASTIQTWYRSLPVVLKRRHLNRERMRVENAAILIQTWYRRLKLSDRLYHFAKVLSVFLENQRRHRAALKIQAYYKMHYCRTMYIKQISIIKSLQCRCRGWLVRNSNLKCIKTVNQLIGDVAAIKQRYNEHIQLRNAVKFVQSRFRANKICKIERNKFIEMKVATIKIQCWYKSVKMMKKEQNEYSKLRKATISIQRHYKANKAMKIERHRYLQLISESIKVQRMFRALQMMKVNREYFQNLKSSTIFIQRRFRANKAMSVEQNKYLTLRNSCIYIQRKFRAVKIMRVVRNRFVDLKRATVFIQRKFRAKLAMAIERSNYLTLRCACITIQQRYRATINMKIDSLYYSRLKSATIFTQRTFRSNKAKIIQQTRYLKLRNACITVQQRYRALQMMKKYKSQYRELKETTLFIQRQFRAKKAMITEKNRYCALREACILVQQKFRALQTMRSNRQYYIHLRRVTIFIQRHFRAKKAMLVERNSYWKLQAAAKTIQQRFRALQIMKLNRTYYCNLRTSVCFIQKLWRANKAMHVERSRYLQLQRSCIIIQRRFRALRTMRSHRLYYVQLRHAAVTLQRRFRANKDMVVERNKYLILQKACITIQQHFTALYKMKNARTYYIQLKKSAVFVQGRFRANRAMTIEQNKYIELRTACILVQRKFRALQMLKKERMYYRKLKETTIFIQERFRANKAMVIHRSRYLELRKASIVIQRQFRSLQAMRIDKKRYMDLKVATIAIQRRFRANRAMVSEQSKYIQMRTACITIQQRFRAVQIMRINKKYYMELKAAVIYIQRRFRANKAMTVARNNYLELQITCINVQRKFRALKMMTANRISYKKLRDATIFTQRRFRANKAMLIERSKYCELLAASILIQRKFRARRMMRLIHSSYIDLRKATILIQRHFRSRRDMAIEQNKYIQLRQACIIIQQRFRAMQIMKTNKEYYMKLKAAVLFIQRRFKANKYREIERSKYLNLRTACITVQQRYRAIKMMRLNETYFKRLKQATVTIQTRYRAHKAMIIQRNKFLEIKTTTITIQTWFRAIYTMRKCRTNYVCLKNAVKVIEERYEAMKLMKKERTAYLKMRKCAFIIQERYYSIIMMRKQREEYVHIKTTCLYIQRKFRTNKLTQQLRQDFVKLKKAAVCIQRRYRARREMVKCRLEFERLKIFTKIVQVRYRAKLLGRQTLKSYQDLRNAAIFIQRTLRSNSFFSVEQRDKRRRLRAEVASAVIIQATWRGYRSRSLTSHKCTEIRKRFKVANENATSSKTLGHRGKAAMEIISVGKCTLLMLSKALEDMALITRRSKEVCSEYCQILPQILYPTLSNTGRSLPEKDINIFSLQILINLYKFEPSRKYSFCPQDMDAILTLMMHWCDKESSLFTTACTLLWLFAHDKKWKRSILSCDIHQKVNRIDTLLSRKMSMVTHSRKKGTSIFGHPEKLYLPNQLPDWGLDIECKPYIFNNAPYAFKCLRKILEI